MVVAASGQNAFFLHALFKPHFFDALLFALFFLYWYWLLGFSTWLLPVRLILSL